MSYLQYLFPSFFRSSSVEESPKLSDLPTIKPEQISEKESSSTEKVQSPVALTLPEKRSSVNIDRERLLMEKAVVDAWHSNRSINDRRLWEIIVKENIDPNLVMRWNNSEEGHILWHMARNGYTQCVSLLLTKGADVNAKNGPNNTTALHGASYWGYEDTVRALLDPSMKVNINAVDSFGNTPLHKNKDMTVLIRAGARTDVRNHKGQLYNECYTMSQ
mgnify:CR=1 FL=1